MAKQVIEVELSEGKGRHHEHIEWVTWKDDAGGPSRREPRETVARRVANGERHYYAKGGGFTAEVEAYSKNNTWFIRTKGDQSKEDNLLSLVK